MFIYFKLILCLLNPSLRLVRYNNYQFLSGSDLYKVDRYSRSKRILAIHIVKSTGNNSHKDWCFRNRNFK